MENDKCLVLLSGGIDSAVSLWWCRNKFKEIYTLTFIYGQKHSKEVEYAKKLSEIAGVVEHYVINLEFLRKLGGSSLTDSSLEIPKGPYPERGTISTYVPMRNSIFGVVAAALMEIKGIYNLVIGVHSSDVPNYPDTRPEWASSLEALINAGSSIPFEKTFRLKVITPLINLRKPEIIKLGLRLGVPFEYTWSCYSPVDDSPCGECPACIQREEAFKIAGLEDPLKKRRLEDDRKAFKGR